MARYDLMIAQDGRLYIDPAGDKRRYEPTVRLSAPLTKPVLKVDYTPMIVLGLGVVGTLASWAFGS